MRKDNEVVARRVRHWACGFGILVGCLVWLLSSPATTGHPIDSWGEFELFRRLSLEQALTAASEQAAIVFVYAAAPGDKAPAYLESPEPRYWHLSKLVIEETVPVQFDIGANAGVLDRYQITACPTMLLLNADGSERGRLHGVQSPETLQTWLEEDLGGPDTVARIQQAIKSAEVVDPLLRERLGDLYFRTGRLEETLQEYVWCVEVGLLRDLKYMRRHRGVLLARFADLAKVHPPALAEMQRIQKDLAERILLQPDNHFNAMTLAELDFRLKRPDHTLKVFDKLPKKSRCRHTLFDHVFAELVRQKRYNEAVYVRQPGKRYNSRVDLAINNPSRALRQVLLAVQLRQIPSLEDPDAPIERGTREYAIMRGVQLVEALAGTNQTEEAIDIAKNLLEFDNTGKTWTLLVQHAKRGGFAGLADHLEKPEVLPVPAQAGEPDQAVNPPEDRARSDDSTPPRAQQE